MSVPGNRPIEEEDESSRPAPPDWLSHSITAFDSILSGLHNLRVWADAVGVTAPGRYVRSAATLMDAAIGHTLAYGSNAGNADRAAAAASASLALGVLGGAAGFAAAGPLGAFIGSTAGAWLGT